MPRTWDKASRTWVTTALCQEGTLAFTEGELADTPGWERSPNQWDGDLVTVRCSQTPTHDCEHCGAHVCDDHDFHNDGECAP